MHDVRIILDVEKVEFGDKKVFFRLLTAVTYLPVKIILKSV